MREGAGRTARRRALPCLAPGVATPLYSLPFKFYTLPSYLPIDQPIHLRNSCFASSTSLPTYLPTYLPNLSLVRLLMRRGSQSCSAVCFFPYTVYIPPSLYNITPSGFSLFIVFVVQARVVKTSRYT
ncbi:hypothetical protein Micbo1qcDRAFT_51523 [Microdochium bolleyi]|uniref:Uncharacterized protein n=1 Tax=Microdochium bolleyi TaxID=196109 RepID=A0A136J6P1_9PEZI|nr:hypothetical protein Micbo1qcDRAFT_51523 [Microdochium bolleyi]